MRFRKRTSAPAGDEVEVTTESGEMAPMEFSLTSRMRDRDRNTRRKLSIWDRSKYTLLLGSLFAFFWWQKIDDNPIKSVADAFWETFEKQAWVLVLLALEWVRQIHFFLAERWAGYYRFWKSTVFGRFDGRSQRLDPWTRFRLGRVLRWIFALVVVSVIVGQVADQSPVDAMVSLPGRMNDALPMAARLIVYPLLMISQFVLLFWFLGRGGIETYFPDDIETRFDDVWGQDPVREKIRENLIFLENPESIEARGGYTPGGILLYGPPGTGKTLLAEAAAGETGKPFVFVEPGAFINMFMGVGIIKVKSLFRKLRKLALRYGGVVVFFDEADSLGNRGAIGGGAYGLERVRPLPRRRHRAGVGDPVPLGGLAARALDLGDRRVAEARDEERRDDDGGRRGRRHAAVVARRDVGPEEAARVLQPQRPQGARHAAEAAAQVPHPGDDGVEHARGARRGDAPAGPHRPHLQGRVPHQGRPHPHLRGLPRQGAPRAHADRHREARHDDARTPPAPASRTRSTRRSSTRSVTGARSSTGSTS